MAIKLNNTTIIDDTRNALAVASITFADATVQTTAGGAGGAAAFGSTIAPGGTLLYTLDNPNAYSTSNDDRFGTSVAISGNYAIVGAFQEDDAGGASSGKVYVYNVSTGALLFTLSNPNAYDTAAYDNFGAHVDISGNYAIVGAYSEDDGIDGFSSGKAYIYNVTTGQLLHTLNNPNAYSTGEFDVFGAPVAISGNYAIVGAYQEDDAGGLNSGKAYVYNVSTGALLYTLDNPNTYSTSDGDYFGGSIAISGNYAIIVAFGEFDASFAIGKAYIFNVTTGALLQTLTAPLSSSQFGNSVAISGNYAIVGAYATYGGGGEMNSGTVYIYNVTTGALLFTLNNPNPYDTSVDDYFGWKVAISGNCAIVGAPGEDDAGGLQSGKVYIYNVSTGALLLTLDNPNAYSTSAGDQFGFSVAISGNYAIVGANFEDDAGGASSAKAYIFRVNDLIDASQLEQISFTNGVQFNFQSDKLFQRAHSAGNLIQTLNNPNAYSTSAGDQFAKSVAISGNYAIVGAHLEDDAAGGGSGKAYIYNVTTGALLFTLDNPNAYSTSANDNFGYSVAISGNYAIVGAYNEDDAGGTSGRAYIYNVTTGTLQFVLNNPNAYSTSDFDQFGNSVAISGNYAIVGALGEDDAGGSGSGKAYIYNVTTGALLYTLNNPNAYSTSANDIFGQSVAISSNYAIVGAYFEDDTGGSGSGKAYIYDVTTGSLLFTLDNPNVAAGDNFGYSVAIDGNYAIIGANLATVGGAASSGMAYIYDVTTGTFLFGLENPNAYSTYLNDQFGTSVAISGNYAIVGAYAEDDAGGSASGKVYIYNLTTGVLLYKLDNPNAYSTGASDNFGNSVAISGNYAIIGANGEADVGGTLSGKAYIFSVTDQTYIDKIVTVGNSIY